MTMVAADKARAQTVSAQTAHVETRLAGIGAVAAVSAPAHAAEEVTVGQITVGQITVEQVPAARYVTWGAAFEDLARRDPFANPFMAPAMVAARSGRFGDDMVVLAAWIAAGAERRLVGAWVLARRRDPWSGYLPVLQTPLEPRHDASAAPVLDAAHAPEALSALLAAVRTLPGLPRTIRASAWPDRLRRHLPVGFDAAPAERWQRSVLTPADVPALWDLPKLRKRLKQERGLQRAGTLAHTALRGQEASTGIGIFLALEASGWKGEAGTALARHDADRADLAAVFDAFAAADRLCVDVLSLDGEPIAAGVQLEAGNGQMFWRTAYDERFSRHSPGVMLDLAVTRRLIAEGRPSIDSGMGPFTNPDSQIWPAREGFAAVTIAPSGHWQGRIVSGLARLRAGLRAHKHRRAG